MFQDEKEELERLQKALMEEPEDEEQIEEEFSLDYDDCAYNADLCDEDLEDYALEVQEEPDRGLTGLALTALLLALGVLGVILWFFLRYRI